MHFFTFTLQLFIESCRFIEPLKQHLTLIMMRMKNAHVSFRQLVKVLNRLKSLLWMKFIDFFIYNFAPLDC